MIEKQVALISNYFWKISMDNINSILSDNQVRNFNINDYYYLTVIHQLGSPNLGDVARELRLTKPSISAMVQRLIKNDLIERVQSAQDKRVYHLSLTERGLKIVQGDNEMYRGLARELESLMDEKQLEDISNLLAVLVNKMAENQRGVKG